jgi:hypothetical protein
MDYSLKKSSIVFIFFSICLLSKAVFAAGSNFILISTHNQPRFIEYKTIKHELLAQPLQKNCELKAEYTKLFSFYSSSDDEISKTIAQKDNKVFLFVNRKKAEILGFISSGSSVLFHQMENTVQEGKLLLAIENKAHQKLALVQDNKGYLYFVKRLSKERYSIQPLGTLVNNS